MAFIEYRRVTDFSQLIKDINLEVTDVLYIPVFDSFADLGIGDGDPDKPGAIAGYMDGGKLKLATYNGDGTWSPVGSDPVTPTLQQVTDEGNTTSNAIQVTGSDGVNVATGSVVLDYATNLARLDLISGGQRHSGIFISNATVQLRLGPQAGATTLLSLRATYAEFHDGSGYKRVRGDDAVDDNDFVTKRQLDSVAPTRTPDPSLSFSTTSSDMDTAHPTANVGDIFYNVDGPSIYVATKIAPGIWEIRQSGT